MPNSRFIPALCLTLMAAFALPQAMADDFAVARPPQWAQPVDAQYNLYQMSPTLYRSALPDDQAQLLLDKLHIGTVINFLPEADSSWLKTPGVEQVNCRTAPIMSMTPMYWPPCAPSRRLRPMARY